jgi:hypothetical protein
MNSPFSPEATAHNALWDAIHKCGTTMFPDQEPTNAVYAWLEDSARTPLVCELAEALGALGYRIVKQ